MQLLYMVKRILVIRHGETKNQELIKEKFINKSKIIAKYISFFKNYKTIHFVSSSLSRCVDTANIIINEVNDLLKTNYVNNIDESLNRWENNIENREDSYKRAINYRERIKTIDSNLIVIISHSSIIPTLVQGLVKNKFDNKEFKNIIRDKKKLIHGSLSFVKFDKKVKYNMDDKELIYKDKNSKINV